jgi:ABC-type polysaccharide/polyol phosphate transport system ATPase subunit
MSQIDVRLERVSKRYRLGTHRSSESFWAVRDISLEVPRGSSLGIIGPNGAGKSTLLKLLAGITAPTEGRISISGVLAALIEVGSGFHPELTGRENIYLSGSILGMRRREIAARLDEIVAFAGVERFVDTPVKWYSSGMYVRLGFAIAAHLHPDVLLVDEVLAVGDAEFQAKCLKRIHDLQQQGVTILFISHDLTSVEQLCDTAVLIDKGEKVAEGPPADVVSTYHRRVVATQKVVRPGDHPAYASNLLKLTNLTFHAPMNPAVSACGAGDPLVVRLRFAATQVVERVQFEVGLHSPDGRVLIGSLASSGGATIHPPGGVVEFEVPSLPLQPGAYSVSAIARDSGTRQPLDWWDGGSTLYVEPSERPIAGQMHIAHTSRIVHHAPDVVHASASPISEG